MFDVTRPLDSKAETYVNFFTTTGRKCRAWIPPSVAPGDIFHALVKENGIYQPIPIILPEDGSINPGDSILVKSIRGPPEQVVVPAGALPGQPFNAMFAVPQPLTAPTGKLLDKTELAPWMEAASSFDMNTDFEVELDSTLLDYEGLLRAMKDASSGKLTIQALGDKIMMGDLLTNMDVPHMPSLVVLRDPFTVRGKVEALIKQHLNSSQAPDLIVKPTHLSSAEGVFTAHGVDPCDHDVAAYDITRQIHVILKRKADEGESAALRSLFPGCIAQPKYKSFGHALPPVEVRVTTLWGRAHSGVWWWGENDPELNT